MEGFSKTLSTNVKLLADSLREFLRKIHLIQLNENDQGSENGLHYSIKDPLTELLCTCIHGARPPAILNKCNQGNVP